MEGHFLLTREEFYHVQMDVKHVQAVQTNHSDRILRLEKRQADDAALKSVWKSPFPSVLGGTPQQGPIRIPSTDIFDDFDDEHGQVLLASLQLDAEEEPVRRGASRASGVRFDVSAIHGSTCAQASRSPGEFGSHPMIERSLSHKSDGRHSSTGHSIHSIHSVLSGRTSSLGLDTNFVIGGDNDGSILDIPEPPPGLFILGTVPSIIRCWLNENFSHNALFYAVVCTGSQNSYIDISLVKEIGLIDQLQKNASGKIWIRLPVYLPEALVTQVTSRTNSPTPQLPTLTATFNVFGDIQRPSSEPRRAIGIFLGSDTLRTYSADVLFSRNLMTLYGDDRNKLSVPFVRPEDETMFQNLRTAIVVSEHKATAPLFTSTEQKLGDGACVNVPTAVTIENDKVQARQLPFDKTVSSSLAKTIVQVLVDSKSQEVVANGARRSTVNDRASPQGLDDRHTDDIACDDGHQYDSISNDHVADVSPMNTVRRTLPGSNWGIWRTGDLSLNDSGTNREHIFASSYQRPNRGGRSMKVLKPSKTSQRSRSSSKARTGAFYEPPAEHISGEFRRKSQAGLSDSNGLLRWESKMTVSDEKPAKDFHPITNISRTSNPVGGASAFAWMNPGKAITTSTRAD